MSKLVGEYRVVNTELPDGQRQFSIRRVVQVTSGQQIVDISEECYPRGDTLEEMIADLNKMLAEALVKPVLINPLNDSDWDLVLVDDTDG